MCSVLLYGSKDQIFFCTFFCCCCLSIDNFFIFIRNFVPIYFFFVCLSIYFSFFPRFLCRAADIIFLLFCQRFPYFPSNEKKTKNFLLFVFDKCMILPIKKGFLSFLIATNSMTSKKKTIPNHIIFGVYHRNQDECRQ